MAVDASNDTTKAHARQRNQPALGREDYLKIYRTMLLSRGFDERCNAIVKGGGAVPHFHSGTGQEALMIASVAPLRPTDQMIYTHRGYGHLMAKGVSVKEVVLDTLMKVGGTNYGLGGVMHVSRPDIGVPGREGAFGTRFSIAAGLALAQKLAGGDDVTLCFYGEAAGARGILYEAMNMAVLWKLPVIYLAENNGWSYSTRTEWLYPEGRMSRVWRGYEIPVEVFDGNDPQAVHSAVSRAIAHARTGKGPVVLEGLTYRIDPHHWMDKAQYQPADEINKWRERDPLVVARTHLRELGVGDDEVAAITAAADAEVAEAFAAADEAPYAMWKDTTGVQTKWA